MKELERAILLPEFDRSFDLQLVEHLLEEEVEVSAIDLEWVEQVFDLELVEHVLDRVVEVVERATD